MWRWDFASTRWERQREEEGDDERERRRAMKWQEGEKQLGRPTANSGPGTWQSFQTPWLCECVCSRVFFFHLCIMTAEWKSICFYICHLECRGAQMGLPCHTELAGSRPTQVFLPLLSPPVLSKLHLFSPFLSSSLLSFPRYSDAKLWRVRRFSFFCADISESLWQQMFLASRSSNLGSNHPHWQLRGPLLQLWMAN